MLKLNNETEINTIAINGVKKNYQGVLRDTLEIHINKGEYSFEQLDELFGDKNNSSKIYVVDGENEYLYEDYTIRTSMELKPVEVQPATTTSKAITEEHVIISMAQMTYIEKQLERLEIK